MKANFEEQVKKKKEEIKTKKENKQDNIADNEILNIENIKNLIGDCEDVKFREIILNDKDNMKIHFMCIDGLVSSGDISNFVIKPLSENKKITEANNLDQVIQLINNGGLYFASQQKIDDLQKVINELVSGNAVILFNDQNLAFSFDTKGFEKRNITPPDVESVTKGPKDSFVENFRTNTATIRRRIKSKDLVLESLVLGKQTNTPISIVYMRNIVNDNILYEVKKRLSDINTDSVISTSIIEDALSDDKHCTFPQVLATERPDKLCASILEGRVGVLVDGIPFSFVVPGTFNQFTQTPEDYSHRYIVATLIRILRLVSLFISIGLPALYVATTLYHPQMIPTNLALFLAESREGVTFPIAMETIMLLIAFEILFEAGLRVPKDIGQAISIVGTLVVGQAAVEAKLLSPAIVVVIATTAITSFTIPHKDLDNTIRLWRFGITLISTTLGLLGFVFGIILFIFKICKLVVFGVSYASPFVSQDGKDSLGDTLFRLPIKINKRRPVALQPKNVTRQGD